MSRAKVGDVLNCEVCGLAVIVDEDCGCATIDLICCEEPMVNVGPAKPKKVQALAAPKKKAKATPKKKKPAAKAAKAAPKKKSIKKKVAKKTVKKPIKKTAKKKAKKK